MIRWEEEKKKENQEAAAEPLADGAKARITGWGQQSLFNLPQPATARPKHTHSSTATHPSYAIRQFIFQRSECTPSPVTQRSDCGEWHSHNPTNKQTHIYRHTAGDRVRSQWAGCAMLRGLVAEFGARPQSRVLCMFLKWVLMCKFFFVFVGFFSRIIQKAPSKI